MTAEPRLLLVGAGHSHLHLLRNAKQLKRAGYRITLIAPRWFDYSGTASAVAAGECDPDKGRIDVAALARRHGVEHHEGFVADADPITRTVTTDDGRAFEWNLISFNIGSVADWPTRVAGPGIIGVKPLHDLARLRERLTITPTGRVHRVTVIGGGSSGLELAAHLADRPGTEVHLLESGPNVGSHLPRRAVTRVMSLLEGRGVQVMTGVAVQHVDADAVHLADGTRVPHDTAVLATGLAAPPVATTSPLGGANGFPVRATLQHRDHDDVYAAGDCADFLPGALPRVGVHGVRQGPVLLAALVARTFDDPAPVYRPQREALSILDLGGGTALAVRGRWWWQGRASRALKRRIDRAWLERYRG